MVRPSAAPDAVDAPPLGTVAPEAKMTVPEVGAEVGAEMGAEMGAEAVMETETAPEPVPEAEMEGVPPQVLAAASGGAAAVAELDARDAARAATDAAEEVNATEDALQEADAALAEFMALTGDVEEDLDAAREPVPEGLLAVEVPPVTPAFPPAEAWIPATSSSRRRLPSRSTPFPRRLAAWSFPVSSRGPCAPSRTGSPAFRSFNRRSVGIPRSRRRTAPPRARSPARFARSTRAPSRSPSRLPRTRRHP